MKDLFISITMLAGILLTIGAIATWFKNRDAKRAALMAVAALVMFFNVVIWVAPLKG